MTSDCSQYIPLAIAVSRAAREQEEARNAEGIASIGAESLFEFYRKAALRIRGSVKNVTLLLKEHWDIHDFEHVTWRQVAQTGKRVTRIYVIPHNGFAVAHVAQQLRHDQEAGIHAVVVAMTKLVNEVPELAIRDMYLLDEDAVLLAPEPQGEAPSQQRWAISERPVDFKNWNEEFEQLLRISEALAQGESIDLEEPLSLSCEMMSQVARVLCTSNHVDRESCEWYHGTWQYLRLLNLVSTPTWHDAFYRRELALVGGPAPRVLISGTADYSLLAYVVGALGKRANMASISVLDMCDTPLFACKWFAKSSGIRITTMPDDILSPTALAAMEFDLICSDAFLTRFSEVDAARVLRVWRRALSSTGRIVTTIRVYDRALPLSSSEERYERFRRRAQQRARPWLPYLDIGENELAELADAYARRMQSHSKGDREQIKALFEGANLRILSEEVAGVEGELSPTRYLRIVAGI